MICIRQLFRELQACAKVLNGVLCGNRGKGSRILLARLLFVWLTKTKWYEQLFVLDQYGGSVNPESPHIFDISYLRSRRDDVQLSIAADKPAFVLDFLLAY